MLEFILSKIIVIIINCYFSIELGTLLFFFKYRNHVYCINFDWIQNRNFERCKKYIFLIHIELKISENLEITTWREISEKFRLIS